jgi:hypothetical protein
MGPHDLSTIQDLACAAGILSIASHNRRTPPDSLIRHDEPTLVPREDMIQRVYRRIMEQLPR